MISIALKHDVAIEGTETIYSLFGDVNRYRPETLLIEAQPSSSRR